MQQEIFDILHTKTFWQRYNWLLFDYFNYAELETPLFFPMPGGYGLSLDLGGDFNYISLGFLVNGQETELAWDDEAHFHPYVLRYGEYRRLVERTAQAMRLPEWLLALLFNRFVGLDKNDDLTKVLAWDATQWQASALFSQTELDALLSKTVFWQRSALAPEHLWQEIDDRGWCYTGADAYSLRSADNPDFPFADFNAMLNMLPAKPDN